jgi:hypothetical protein
MMKRFKAFGITACLVAWANTAYAQDETPPTNHQPARTQSKVTAQARVNIVDMVKVENGRGSGSGPMTQQLKRRISCGAGTDVTVRLCDETLFEVE